jgi:predicted GNAT family acetyltransferase
MKLRLHDSVDDFCSVALDIYRRDPISATVELAALRAGLADSDPAPLLVTVWDCQKPIGAALQRPRLPLLCGGLPPAAVDHVVAEFLNLGIRLTGIQGPSATAAALAAAWCSATGMVSTVAMNQRLYRLETLRPPPSVAGHARPAGPGDIDMLAEWVMLFSQEAFGDTPDRAASTRSVQAGKARGDEFVLWTLPSGPVSLAAVRPAAAGVSRIGPVYTPITERGHGYGSAVTAAAAAWAREHGADDVVLFTDLANPTSNTIYQRIGFQPISEYDRIDFTWQQ